MYPNFLPFPLFQALTGRSLLLFWIIVGFHFLNPASSFAQLSQPMPNHYVGGSEGLMASLAPPPGWTVRNYTFYYASHRMNDASGAQLPYPFKTYIIADADRITYMQGLGDFYQFGSGVVITEARETTNFGPIHQVQCGLTDLQLQPVVFTYQDNKDPLKRKWDVATALGLFVPSARYNRNLITPLGKGFYTGIYTLGCDYSPLPAATISFLNRLEFSSQQEQTGLQPGKAETFEWGVQGNLPLNKARDAILAIGPAGYSSWQFTQGSPGLHEDERIAIGPEAVLMMLKTKTMASIRFEHEIIVKDGPQGDFVNLSITQAF